MQTVRNDFTVHPLKLAYQFIMQKWWKVWKLFASGVSVQLINPAITLSCYYWITDGEKVNTRKLDSAIPKNAKLPSIVSATL